jgi:hypothetical protein
MFLQNTFLSLSQLNKKRSDLICTDCLLQGEVDRNFKKLIITGDQDVSVQVGRFHPFIGHKGP